MPGRAYAAHSLFRQTGAAFPRLAVHPGQLQMLTMSWDLSVPDLCTCDGNIRLYFTFTFQFGVCKKMAVCGVLGVR